MTAYASAPKSQPESATRPISRLSLCDVRGCAATGILTQPRVEQKGDIVLTEPSTGDRYSTVLRIGLAQCPRICWAPALHGGWRPAISCFRFRLSSNRVLGSCHSFSGVAFFSFLLRSEAVVYSASSTVVRKKAIVWNRVGIVAQKQLRLVSRTVRAFDANRPRCFESWSGSTAAMLAKEGEPSERRQRHPRIFMFAN